jgi:hypothetical protein
MLLRIIMLALLSRFAQAQVAPSASMPVEKDPSLCSAESWNWCQDGVGGAITSLDSLRVTKTGVDRSGATNEERAQRQSRAIFPGLVSGMSAGADSIAGWTIWGSGSVNRYESEITAAPYEADTYNYLLGADRFFGDQFMAGFTLGYEDTDTETRYNGGDQNRNGLLLALYGAYLIDDVFSLDGTAGYQVMDTAETRIDPGTPIRVGTAATPGATIGGSYDSVRTFATVNFNAVKAFGKWVLGGRIGALHVVERQDAYAETGGAGARTIRRRHLDLTQAYASVDLGYSAGAFEPYALLGYRNDLSRDDGKSAGGLPAGVSVTSGDDDDWQAGIGVRYFGSNGVSGSFEWLTTFGRDKFDEGSIALTVRVPL